MLHIIANHNVLVKSFNTNKEVTDYIKSQRMVGDECQFEGYYFNCYEILKDGEQGIFNQGVDWSNLKSFEDYKAEKDEATAKFMSGMSNISDDNTSFEDIMTGKY